VHRRIDWLLQTFSPIVWLTIGWGVSFLPFWWFRNGIIAVSHEFVGDMLFMLYFTAGIILLGGIIWRIVWGLLHRSVRSGLLALVVFVFAWWLVVASNRVETSFYFWLDRRERDGIVTMIEHGQLSPDPAAREYNRRFGEWIKLPAGHEHLSKLNGGDVLVYRASGVTQILFPDYVGILGEYDGYVYRSDDQPPSSPSPTTAPIETIERLDDHWYWIYVDD
jgi:hypothetical protein